jgi:cyclopropane fatty-acyl-phospholipid synthase-like methyltransferase
MTKTPATPARVVWAVSQLPVRPDHRVLEVGAGRGAAAELVCARLHSGSYLGIDRSVTAITSSAQRNQQHVERNVAQFRVVALEDVDPSSTGQFDIIFAVNVNLFWTEPDQRGLTLARRLLADQGQLWLFYEAPTPAASSRVGNVLVERLNAAGYAYEMITETIERSLLLRLHCLPGRHLPDQGSL